MISRILHQVSIRMAECPPVAQLCKPHPPAHRGTNCLNVLDMFLKDRELYAVPVVHEDNAPLALIDRQSYVEYFTRPYVREIHGRKNIVDFLKSDSAEFSTSTPIIVDELTAIDDVANMIIDAGMQHMVTGFIVTRDNQYMGLANGHDLLDEITRRKQSDLYYLAHFDQLTGLPNRMLFADRLNQACLDATRNESMVGVMFVDLDRFKQINDSMGHGFGDQILRSVAERLQQYARESDTVARLGGDEFAIVMDNIKHADDPMIVAQRIVDGMKENVLVGDRFISVTASIGIALYPADDTDIAALLAKADTAMYEAKASGRNCYRVFQPGLTICDSEQMTLETDLRRAVENNEFLLYYQPKVSLKNGAVVGVEALIRWRHPTQGMISPAFFIPLAEESGMIIDIGTWVLRQACIQHCLWRDGGLPPIQMAINISPLQFRQEDFVDQVRSVIAETGIDPKFVELEMTEGTVMLNVSSVLETLKKLKEIGVRLAIDDFGTGYSNLNYLKHFPIDCIKIDQSFVRGIDGSTINESIVRAIVAMANCLSMETVAEGTENMAELDIVKACLCGSAQGYHFAKPMPPNELSKWVKEFQTETLFQTDTLFQI